MNDLFKFFFTELENAKIDYAITGMTEEYPDIISSDVDIIIPTHQVKAYYRFMKNIDRFGIAWIQVISHEITSCYSVISISENNSHQFMKPDMSSDYYNDGVLFLKAKYLLENKYKDSRGFYLLSSEKEFIYYFLKKVEKNKISESQFGHIYSHWNKSPQESYLELKKFFSKEHVQLIKQILDDKNYDLLKSYLDEFHRELHRNLKFNIVDFSRKLINRCYRIIQPTGLVVAFMGPDGCGKTTVIQSVNSELNEAFRNTKQFHFLPREMESNSKTITEPHAKEPRDRFTSFLKLGYFLVTYLFGYLFKVYPLKVRSTLVIFDRYYHDIMVDSIRYRNSSSLSLIKIIGKLIPQPDLWMFLDAPVDIIQKRKSEVTAIETDRQLKAYKDLSLTLKNAHVLDSSQPEDVVKFEVQKIIIAALEKRNANRFRFRNI